MADEREEIEAKSGAGDRQPTNAAPWPRIPRTPKVGRTFWILPGPTMKWPIGPQETLIRLDARGVLQVRGPDDATTDPATTDPAHGQQDDSSKEAARVSASGLSCPKLGYPARGPASWRR